MGEMGEMGEGGTERRLIDTGTGKREVRGGREGITRLSRSGEKCIENPIASASA